MSKSLGTGVDPLDLMEQLRRRRHALRPDAAGHRQPGHQVRRGEAALQPQLREQDLEREPLRAHEPRRLRAGRRRAPTPSADAWILSRLADLAARVDEGILTYEFGETARALYDFFWSEFCDWYIELAKGRLAEGGEAAPRRAAQPRVRARPGAAAAASDDAVRDRGDLAPPAARAKPTTAPSLMVAAWPEPGSLARFHGDEGAGRAGRSRGAGGRDRPCAACARATSVAPRAAVDVVVKAAARLARPDRGRGRHLVRSLAGIGRSRRRRDRREARALGRRRRGRLRAVRAARGARRLRARARAGVDKELGAARLELERLDDEARPTRVSSRRPLPRSSRRTGRARPSCPTPCGRSRGRLAELSD